MIPVVAFLLVLVTQVSIGRNTGHDDAQRHKRRMQNGLHRRVQNNVVDQIREVEKGWRKERIRRLRLRL